MLSRSPSGDPDAVSGVILTLLETLFTQIGESCPPPIIELFSDAVMFLCTTLRQHCDRLRLSKFKVHRVVIRLQVVVIVVLCLRCQCKSVLNGIIRALAIPGSSSSSVFGAGSSRESRALMALALSQFLLVGS